MKTCIGVIFILKTKYVECSRCRFEWTWRIYLDMMIQAYTQGFDINSRIWFKRLRHCQQLLILMDELVIQIWWGGLFILLNMYVWLLSRWELLKCGSFRLLGTYYLKGGGGCRGLTKCRLQWFWPFWLHLQRPNFTPSAMKFWRNLQYQP